jgi:hypothetical protein
MPSKPTLPIDAFPTWARFNDVDFMNAKLQETDGKGIGLVTIDSTDLTGTAEAEDEINAKGLQYGESKASEENIVDGARAGTRRREQATEPLLRIPHDLILSASTVEEYTKVDQNFRQLIDSVGHNVRLLLNASNSRAGKTHRPVQAEADIVIVDTR